MSATFTAQEYAARMRRAVSAAVADGYSGLLVTPGPDLRHLTGYAPTAATERLTLLVLVPQRAPTLVVPRLELPDARRCGAATELAFVDWPDGEDPYLAAGALLQPAGRYVVSDSAWAMHLLGLQRALPASTYVSLTDGLPMLRAVKQPLEVDRLAAAGAGADEAYRQILRRPFAGRTEREVAGDLAALLREHGHEQVDFTLVCSGPNGANPHHEPGERTIEAGDAVVLDFGGLRDGYGSDTTRTVCVGDPSAELRAVHEVVRRAQQAAFEAVRPGVACQEIDRVARRIITEAGYGERFIHRVGHGIGMTTHEPPYLVEGETRALVAGMCFSIEPGVYLPGQFGVRIEDIVTVTEQGARRLNNTDRDLMLVA